MATQVILPVLGETVNESTIVEWFKGEGDPVSRGDVLFSVESDKAVLEVEAPAQGILRTILVPAGHKVPVLTVVALITPSADEPISAESEPGLPERASSGQTGAGAAAPEASAILPAATLPQGGRLFASPRARKTAREKGVALRGVPGSGPEGRIEERDVLAFLALPPSAKAGALPAATGLPAASGLPAAAGRAGKATPVAERAAAALGVDLARVAGTGSGGQITRADVEAAGAAPADAEAPSGPVAQAAGASAGETVPMAGLRRIISERMSASHQATARVTLVTEADATALVEVREQLRVVEAEWGFAPGYNDLLGLIVARALSEFPYMNARLSADGQTIERLPTVNLGMAVDTERGLLVPVIRSADHKGLRTFGTEFRALVDRARAGRATPDDLTGGTFTITNLGMYEVDAFTPIINLPEAAILGVGRIQSKAVVREGSPAQIVVRQMWTLSLAFDHRLVDGGPAARFLQRIKRLVESPYLLLG